VRCALGFLLLAVVALTALGVMASGHGAPLTFEEAMRVMRTSTDAELRRGAVLVIAQTVDEAIAEVRLRADKDPRARPARPPAHAAGAVAAAQDSVCAPLRGRVP
jgi:hypothetical protein